MACFRLLCPLVAWVSLATACSADGSSAMDPSAGGVAGASGAGGAAGTVPGGGGAPSRTFLGRACSSDVDCGLGLLCLKAGGTELDDAWPAQGYCTVACTGSSACEALDAGAVCHAYPTGDYCLLGCDPLAGAEEKCHGRREVACVPEVEGSSDTVCMPRCGSDADCCASSAECEGVYCSPASGLCSAAPPTGAVTGASCNSDPLGTCQGRCVALRSGTESTNVCADVCTFGVYPSCGWSPSAGPAEARCHHAEGSEAMPGNGGLCAQLCDCDADCRNGALVCVPFQDSADRVETGRAGVCDLADSGLPRCPGAAGAPAGEGGGAGHASGAAGTSATQAGSANGGSSAPVPAGAGGVAGGAGYAP